MAKEKKNIFARFFGAIGKFFRDLLAEVKKVVWPSKKQVINNTGIVLVLCAICGVILVAADSVFMLLNRLLFGA